MNKHNIDLSNRILENPIFATYPPKNLKLSDPVLVYHDGNYWKIIPLALLSKYVCIYDIITEKNKEKNIVANIPVTIAFCPFTFTCAIYEDTYFPSEFVLNSSLILKNKYEGLLPIITGILDQDNKNSLVRRWQCDIKLLRNALSDNPDPKFLLSKNDDRNELSPLFSSSYLIDNSLPFKILDENKKIKTYHPKTLVRLVQYISTKNGLSYSIIVGKKSTSETPTGFDTHKSNFDIYFEQMNSKLVDKLGFVMPIFWFACEPFLDNSKVVNL